MKGSADPEFDAENHSLAFADVARVLGIGMVVLQHLAILGMGGTHGGLVDKATGYFGVLGVSILFLLSGYLLGRPYLRAVLNQTQLPSARTFYLKRLLRIYPLYAFAVVLFSGLNIATGRLEPSTAMVFISHLLLVHNFSLVSAQAIETPMWTMAVDAQFYLVLPLLSYCAFAAFSRVAIARRPAACATSLITLAVIGVAIRLLVMRCVQRAHRPSTSRLSS